MTFKSIMDIIRSIRRNMVISGKGAVDDFFAGRITHAATCPTVMDMIEFLSKSVGASIEYTKSIDISNFVKAANSSDANAVLVWVREHPKITAMIARSKEEDYEGIIESIDIYEHGESISDGSTMPIGIKYDIPISMELLSPLIHGGDMKSGNATLFRRCQVITPTGRCMHLPFVAGNSLRGKLRDLLADHFLSSLGIPARRDVPFISLWFFHSLYSGGVLEEKSKSTDAIDKKLGKNGALRTDGLRQFRHMIPGMSILGSALGNKIICGRISVGDLRPQCIEWGTGDVPVAQIMDWKFITRRDDYEGRGDDDLHTGMIINMEVVKSGVVFDGGIDIDTHASGLEKSALATGLKLLQENGQMGAKNSCGFGKVQFSIQDVLDYITYEEFLREHKGEILEYLRNIGALADASS